MSVDSRAYCSAAALRLVSGDLFGREIKDIFSAGAELATGDVEIFTDTLGLFGLPPDTSVGGILALLPGLAPCCLEESLGFLAGYCLIDVIPLARGPNLANITGRSSQTIPVPTFQVKIPRGDKPETCRTLTEEKYVLPSKVAKINHQDRPVKKTGR